MIKRYHLGIGLCFITIFSLLLAACGDSTPTTVPAPATAAPTNVPATTFPSTTAATTLVVTTAVPTTISATTLAAATVVPPTTIANSPVEFVRKLTFTNSDISPIGITVDRQGIMYGVYFQGSKIYKYDETGKFVLSWGGKGNGDSQFAFDAGNIKNNFNEPKGGSLAIDSKGNIYVADTYNHRVQKFDPSGKLLTKWGSEGTEDGQFRGTSGIAIDNQDNVYVTEFQGSRLQKFDSSGKFLLKFGSRGSEDGQFKYPGSIALDSKGNIYITDGLNYRIQKFDPNGKFLSKFGSSGAKDGEFETPGGLVIDNQDNIYVAEESPRIQKFDSTGKFIGKWTGTGSTNFRVVIGLSIDSKGNIYVFDQPGNNIYQFRPKS